MVSKRRTRRRRNRQLKGGDTEQNSNLFAPFKTAFDQTRKDLLAKGADMNKKFKKKAADLVTDAANKAQESLADGEKDADKEKSKWCINNGFEKATENADREVTKEVDNLEHDVERPQASSTNTNSIPQHGGRKRRKTKRRKTKRRKTKRRKTKKNTKRRKKRKSRRRRRK